MKSNVYTPDPGAKMMAKLNMMPQTITVNKGKVNFFINFYDTLHSVRQLLIFS